MSRRYIWAGEIIDTGDGGVNLDDEEIVGRLNGLDQENTKLNAELTETIAAVSDLMDENAELRLKLAGSKAYASRREIELGRVLLERFHLRRQFAEVYDKVLGIVTMMEQPEEGTSDELELIYAFNDEVHKASDAIRALIPTKEADHAGS
ncbi:MAG TPA: hypothetical protein VMV40_00815 [Acidiferrobacter sp.]|nr:hypothetical protein [Acidiferrobacter sp.]